MSANKKIYLVIIFSLLVPLTLFNITKATGETDKKNNQVIFTPQISIPNSGFTAGQKVSLSDSTVTLANYIVAIFKYSIGVIGIIAAIVLMFAGVRWLTAGGNQMIISEAKNYIVSSLSGLVLTLGAFLLLSTINVKLTNLDITTIAKIQNVPLASGCCLKTDKQDPSKVTAATITEGECNKIDYATTKFFQNYVAFSDPKNPNKQTCLPDRGCCIVTASHKFLLPKVICHDNDSKDSCLSEQSNWFKFYISGPVLGLGYVYHSNFVPLPCTELGATEYTCTEFITEQR